jgi:hypothetical protein
MFSSTEDASLTAPFDDDQHSASYNNCIPIHGIGSLISEQYRCWIIVKRQGRREESDELQPVFGGGRERAIVLYARHLPAFASQELDHSCDRLEQCCLCICHLLLSLRCSCSECTTQRPGNADQPATIIRHW